MEHQLPRMRRVGNEQPWEMLKEIVMQRGQLLLAVLVIGAISSNALAQEASAGITGRISDPSGAAVRDASVTARDADRGTTWVTKSSDEGAYTFTRLPLGRYEVKVEAN